MSELGLNAPTITCSYGDGTGRFKVASEGPEKRGIDFAIPGLVV